MRGAAFRLTVTDQSIRQLALALSRENSISKESGRSRLRAIATRRYMIFPWHFFVERMNELAYRRQVSHVS
jgi:hypothetical protein